MNKEANMKETIFMIHGMWCGPFVWEKFAGYPQGEGARMRHSHPALHEQRADGSPHPELFPGRSHWLLAESGWKVVAEYVEGWLRAKESQLMLQE